MNPLRNLSVRANLMVLAGISLGAMLMLVAVAYSNMSAANVLAEHLLEDVKLARAAGSADMMHDALRGDALAARLAGAQASAQEKQGLQKELAEHVQTLNQSLGEVGQSSSAETRKVLDQVDPDVKAYVAAAHKLVDAAFAGHSDETLQKAFDAAFTKLEEDLEHLSAQVEQSAQASVLEKARVQQRAQLSMALSIALAAGLIVGFSMLFARTTLRRLGAEPQELRDFALRIAQGDLSARLHEMAPTDSVAGAMLRMQGMLSTAVQAIRGNAENVASASAQIAQGNEDLSSRTEEQAAALEQTAASMEQLSGTVKQNADNAKQGNQLARGASDVASRGGEVVGQVVQTMRGINDSSKKIADIIGVIDSIAFQTNILALNAAVEAARAGEQGRGFAVVASEVRNLAQRSADAAKEIKSLITASVERVEHGTTLVDQAGATMDEVVGAIRRVTDIMGEISTASNEQSNGVTQVGEAVTQMDQTTQQNAALVEQSAAAAKGLQEQAQALLKAVSTFRLSQAAMDMA